MKKIITVTLVLLITHSVAFAAGYKDTEGHWAREEIDRWSQYGILEGYDSERFGPDDPISRGQMATIVDRMLSYTLESGNLFSDVDTSAYFAAPISKAAAHGVLQGYGDGTMRPNNNITQEEAIVMLNRAFSVGTQDSAEGYTSASDWAKPEVYGMAGALSGIEFQPTRPITRAETVKILDNLVSKMYGQPGNYNGGKERFVIVTTPDAVIEDAEILGNIIISEQIGDGDVTIRNSTIKGTLVVCGGGANTVKLDNCDVDTISMERKTGFVRLLTSGETTIGSVQVAEKAKLDLSAGTAGRIEIHAAGTDLNVGKHAKVETLTVEQTAKVAVEGTVVSAYVAKEAEKTAFSGKGKLESVTDDSGSAKVSTAGTAVTKDGKTITTSSSSGSSGGSSSSSSSSSGRPKPVNPSPEKPTPTPTPLSIDHVVCNDSGLLKVHFNRTTDTELAASAFEVICPRGSAPEIRRVETTDKSVYYIHTTQYKDNDYQIIVTLPDGTRIEKLFTVKFESAQIMVAYLDRLDAQTAKLTYSSDTPGTFYYILQELPDAVLSEKPHAVPVESEEMSASQVKTGITSSMDSSSNELTIPGLAQGKSYALYYCSEDVQGRTSLVYKVIISSEPAAIQSAGVEFAEPFFERINVNDFYYGFTVKLTAPTKTALPVTAFTASCPTGNASLSHVTTTDNQTYKVYMPLGTLIYKNNHYDLHITLEDGTLLETRCYVDFKSPQVRCYAFEWKDAETLVAFISSDSAGTLYYKLQPTVEGIDTVAGKSPADVYATGQTVEIAYGDNLVTLKGAGMGGQYLCMAAERTNAAGQVNRQEYLDYKQIPPYVESEQPEDNMPQITNIKVISKGNQPSMRIYLNRDPQEISWELMSVSGTVGKIASSIMREEDSIYLTLDNQTGLSDGEHTLVAVIDQQYVTYTFIV